MNAEEALLVVTHVRVTSHRLDLRNFLGSERPSCHMERAPGVETHTAWIGPSAVATGVVWVNQGDAGSSSVCVCVCVLRCRVGLADVCQASEASLGSCKHKSNRSDHC